MRALCALCVMSVLCACCVRDMFMCVIYACYVFAMCVPCACYVRTMYVLCACCVRVILLHLTALPTNTVIVRATLGYSIPQRSAGRQNHSATICNAARRKGLERGFGIALVRAEPLTDELTLAVASNVADGWPLTELWFAAFLLVLQRLPTLIF